MIEYSFKRGIYYDVLKGLEETSVVVLMGPRKCGKTVCLKQIAEDLAKIHFEHLDEEYDYTNVLLSKDKKDIVKKVVEDRTIEIIRIPHYEFVYACLKDKHALLQIIVQDFIEEIKELTNSLAAKGMSILNN